MKINFNNMRNKLAIFYSFVSVFYLFCVTFLNVPEKNHRVVDTILGFLIGTLVATIINYYFGDSQKTQAKSENSEG